MLCKIRSLTPKDEPFLWEMLYQAIFIPPQTQPLPRDIIYQPELAKYVQNWQEDETGFVAVLESSQTPIGAAWIRLFTSHNPGYGYISDEIPELSIAILPEYRNRGIGTQLLLHLFEHIKNRYPAICLSGGKTGWVTSQNPHLGWFVGYLEQGDRVYFFATNIDMPSPKLAKYRVEITRRCLKQLGLLEAAKN